MNRTLASLVLLTGTMTGLGTSPASAQDFVDAPVTIDSIEVLSIVVGEDGVVANAVVTLDIVGRKVPRFVELPVDLEVDDSPSALQQNGCPILSLSVGPLDLDLLGLVVQLDDCDGGPVTIDITAIPGDGKLLGNLLCAVAGLLDGGFDLGEILAGLTDAELGLLGDLLNNFFDQLLGGGQMAAMNHGGGPGGGGPPGQGGGGPPGQGGGGGSSSSCTILDLQLGPIELDLLGLEVVTSEICLLITAERGQGNLLGNLLCTLVGLLDGPGNTGLAQQALVRNISRLLDRLGLAI